MANSRQATKRARQAEKNRLHNASQKSELRTYIKATLAAVADKNASLAKECFVKAATCLDRAGRRGLIHPNRAARLKSRLNTKIKAIA